MEPTTIVAKAQPWKAFLVVPTQQDNTIEPMQGAIRLRLEADDKGGLGG